MRSLLIILLFMSACSLAAQNSFQDKITEELAAMQVQVFSPIEEAAYPLEKDKNKFLATDFILKHSDKLEVRVEYFSHSKDSIAISNPHIKNGIRLGHLINNVEESNISLHRLGSEDLILYGADWATQATFRPKPEFSDKMHCQLISIYKEEVGLLFLYLLFDDMNKYKDEWRYLIGFNDSNVDTIK